MTELDDKNLDRAVEQATNPIIRQPTVLDAEALKPMSLADRLPANPKVGSPKTVPELDEFGNVKPKRRGRPPGSKNKTTLEREAAARGSGGGARMVTPPGKGAKPSEGLTLEQRVAHKQARAAELSVKVGEAINDNLMLLLMSMGAPSALIYNPGMEPAQTKAESKYTPLGQQLVLGPMQMNIVGRFLAELEATDIGGKAGAQLSDGKGPLIIYGVLSLGAMIQWAKGLSDAYKQFEPMLKAYQAQQNVAQQQAQQGNQQDTGGYRI